MMRGDCAAATNDPNNWAVPSKPGKRIERTGDNGATRTILGSSGGHGPMGSLRDPNAKLTMAFGGGGRSGGFGDGAARAGLWWHVLRHGAARDACGSERGKHPFRDVTGAGRGAQSDSVQRGRGAVCLGAARTRV